VNAKAKNYTRGKLRQKLGEVDKAIERYLGELDRADEVFEQTGTVLPVCPHGTHAAKAGASAKGGLALQINRAAHG
jgi:hypothetical protein